MTTRTRSTIARTRLAGLTALVVLALAVTACDSDDDPAPVEPSTGTTTSSEPTTPSIEPTSPVATAATTAPSAPVLELQGLTGQDTSIALDAGFLDALSALGLTPGVVGKATIQDGSLVLPITGGDVTVTEPDPSGRSVTGTIEHGGAGFSLSAGSRTVEVSDLAIDLGAGHVVGDMTVDGKVAQDVVVLDLDLSTQATPAIGRSEAVLEGGRVQLAPALAQLVDSAFGTDAVRPGLLVGVARITLAVS